MKTELDVKIENYTGPEIAAIQKSLAQLDKNKFSERLMQKDASLWKSETAHQNIIKNSLGWLSMPEVMIKRLEELLSFQKEIQKSGIKKVLLLGMGGSSLAPEVFRQVFGTQPGYPELFVLDATDPDSIQEALSKAPPEESLYIVASKSGTTVEPMRFFDFFYHQVKKKKGKQAGYHFAAITDPGTVLEKKAKELKFRKIFINFPDIGGRYSALSYFGLVPAALMGVDVMTLLKKTQSMARECHPDIPAEDNPAVILGTILGILANKGLDKITFLTSKELESFGLWLEQLLAESTGKEGKGVIPISGEPLSNAKEYSKDRVFVTIQISGQKDMIIEKLTEDLVKARRPVIQIELGDKLEMAAEFLRWEIATSVIGYFLKINPFDQPNVQQAKDLTKKLLTRLIEKGTLPKLENNFEEGQLSFTMSEAWSKSIKKTKARSISKVLSQTLAQSKAGDYIGLQAYLSSWKNHDDPLHDLRNRILLKSGCPVQFGFGPRYLHTTGQLHNGGPNNGIFIVLSHADPQDVEIPGCDYSFQSLVRAQAIGDFKALAESGRRALFVDIKGDVNEAIKKIQDLI